MNDTILNSMILVAILLIMFLGFGRARADDPGETRICNTNPQPIEVLKS